VTPLGAKGLGLWDLHGFLYAPAVRLRLIGLVLVCAGEVGCVTPSVRLDEAPREYVASDYPLVLRRWTRSQDLINFTELDNLLTATATYESWDFRWAYAIRYAEDYRLTIDQRTSLLERSLAETRDAHQFYLALYAERFKWNDLTKTDPAWIVRLIDDEGTETTPNEIVPVKRPGAIELTYFPYTTPWRSAFRISFPMVRADGRPTISSAARWFGLRFAGAQGNCELIWEIEGDTRTRLSRGPKVRPTL